MSLLGKISSIASTVGNFVSNAASTVSSTVTSLFGGSSSSSKTSSASSTKATPKANNNDTSIFTTTSSTPSTTRANQNTTTAAKTTTATTAQPGQATTGAAQGAGASAARTTSAQTPASTSTRTTVATPVITDTTSVFAPKATQAPIVSYSQEAAQVALREAQTNVQQDQGLVIVNQPTAPEAKKGFIASIVTPVIDFFSDLFAPKTTTTTESQPATLKSDEAQNFINMVSGEEDNNAANTTAATPRKDAVLVEAQTTQAPAPQASNIPETKATEAPAPQASDTPAEKVVEAIRTEAVVVEEQSEDDTEATQEPSVPGLKTEVYNYPAVDNPTNIDDNNSDNQQEYDTEGGDKSGYVNSDLSNFTLPATPVQTEDSDPEPAPSKSDVELTEEEKQRKLLEQQYTEYYKNLGDGVYNSEDGTVTVKVENGEVAFTYNNKAGNASASDYGDKADQYEPVYTEETASRSDLGAKLTADDSGATNLTAGSEGAQAGKTGAVAGITAAGEGQSDDGTYTADVEILTETLSNNASAVKITSASSGTSGAIDTENEMANTMTASMAGSQQEEKRQAIVQIVTERIQNNSLEINNTDSFVDALVKFDKPQEALNNLEQLQRAGVDIEALVKNNVDEGMLYISQESLEKIAKLKTAGIDVDALIISEHRERVFNLSENLVDQVARLNELGVDVNQLIRSDNPQGSIRGEILAQNEHTVNQNLGWFKMSKQSVSAVTNPYELLETSENIASQLTNLNSQGATNWQGFGSTNTQNSTILPFLSVTQNTMSQQENVFVQAITSGISDLAQTSPIISDVQETEETPHAKRASKHARRTLAKKSLSPNVVDSDDLTQAIIAATVVVDPQVQERERSIAEHESRKSQTSVHTAAGAAAAEGQRFANIFAYTNNTPVQKYEGVLQNLDHMNKVQADNNRLGNVEYDDSKRAKYYHDANILVNSDRTELRLEQTGDILQSAYKETYMLNGESYVNYYDINGDLIVQENTTRGLTIVKAGDDGLGHVAYNENGEVIEVTPNGSGVTYMLEANEDSYKILGITKALQFPKRNIKSLLYRAS